MSRTPYNYFDARCESDPEFKAAFEEIGQALSKATKIALEREDGAMAMMDLGILLFVNMFSFAVSNEEHIDKLLEMTRLMLVGGMKEAQSLDRRDFSRLN